MVFMIKKIHYFSGTLRIFNPYTLQKWKDNGEYQKLIDSGYYYHPGCGRFINIEICTCSKCRKYENNRITQEISGSL